jgi:membrane protease YdiL (CAAX protease family)
MISAKPWNLHAMARLVLNILGSLCGGMVLAGAIGLVKWHLPEEQVQFIQMAVMVISFQGAALVWIVFFLKQSNITWADAFGLRHGSPLKALLGGLAMGAVVLPIAILLQMASETVMQSIGFKPEAQAVVKQLQGGGFSVVEKVVMGLLTVVLAPIAEESIFRGILYPAIKQTGRPRWALWGTSVLFGLMHFNMATFIPLVFLAVVFVFLYEASGNLLTPIGAHGMFNAANFCYLILASGPSQTLPVK